ncbi:glycosyltransferase, partial [Vibrio sp. 10N.222.54.A1]
MTKNKKFVLIASFPGSIQSFRGALIRAIQNKGYDVHVIVPNMPMSLQDSFKIKNISVHQVKLQRTGLNPFADIIYFFKIYKILN